MFLLFNCAFVIPIDGGAFSLVVGDSKYATCSCCRAYGSDRRSRLHSLGFRGRFAPKAMSLPAPDSLVPQSAFFVGLGGGWEAANFGNQNVFGRGTSFTPPIGGHGTPQIGTAAGSTGLDLENAPSSPETTPSPRPSI